MTASFNKTVAEQGYITVDPKPTEEELTRFYRDLYYQDPETVASSYQSSYSDEEIAHRRLLSDLCLYAISQCRPLGPQASFLEIGCGEGWTLKAAQDRGYDVAGVEFSEAGIERFHPELRDSVDFGDAYAILDRMVEVGRNFDVCVMENVIEHVIDPADLMTRIRRVVAANGLIVVKAPNDYSKLQTSLLESGALEDEFWFAPPEHLSYFNTGTIVTFAESLGFSVRDLYCDFPVDFYLANRNSNYARDRSKGRDAHIAKIQLDLLMAQNGLDAYLDLCRAWARCGVGRNFTLIVESA